MSGPDFVLKNQTIAFWDFPKPLIFAVNGLAVGGGANLALVNFGDMVIASSKARFLYPFAKLGLTPELGSSMMMPYVTTSTLPLPSHPLSFGANSRALVAAPRTPPRPPPRPPTTTTTTTMTGDKAPY